jgi:hypothetical protein
MIRSLIRRGVGWARGTGPTGAVARGVRQRARNVGLGATLLSLSIFFALWLHNIYPLQNWLFFRFAAYWIGALFWVGSCQIAGYAMLGWMFQHRLPKVEQATLGLAMGVLAFGLAVFAIGLVGGLGTLTFFALPLGFAVLGWRVSARAFTKLVRRNYRRQLSLTAWQIPVLGLSVLALGVAYFQILSPEAFSFDVRWYHMPIAQRYALTGHVARFEEGFWPAAFPHLLSYIYAWAFLSPRSILFDHVELCAHIEFVLFLATLCQIPVLVRRMVPRARVGLTWVMLLLFPGLYVYDLNLHAGADRVAGFWALPIALALLRSWRRPDPLHAGLLALLVGGALLTKYTAVSIALPACVAFLARCVGVAVRNRSSAAWRSAGTFIGCGLVITAPHWLKNLIWYGDPIYPMLHAYFPSRPWAPEAASRLTILEGTGRPGSLDLHGLLQAAQAMFTFSFIPNNFEFLYGNWPVFGSLFTLSLPLLPFTRGAARVAWLYLLAMGAVFLWYMLSHYDRYLVAVVPWMAAATAACFILVAREGWVARLGLLCLAALQLVWGGTIPFLRGHNQLGDSPIRQVSLFMASGFEHPPRRLDLYQPLSTISRLLPKDATVLAHDHIMILGLDRNWVTDLHQLAFNYARLGSPAAIHEKLVQLGVTHLVWQAWSINRDSLAEDLAFFNYAYNYTVEQTRVGDEWVARLPALPPSASTRDYDVAHYGCGNPYGSGWFHLSQLTLPVVNSGKAPAPIRRLTERARELDGADFVVIDTACHKDRDLGSSFKLASTRDQSRLYLRSPPRIP